MGTYLDPTARPGLNLVAALDALDRHGVRWVLSGSLVLIAYGARFVPSDLDITPALDDENLEAIADLAADLRAIPRHVPEWSECPPIEWHYEWQPRPATAENLDHLLVTNVGLLDIVPKLCGTHKELAPGSTPADVGGHTVFVADPRTVLDRIDGLSRVKDQARRQQVAQVRTALDSGEARLTGLSHLT